MSTLQDWALSSCIDIVFRCHKNLHPQIVFVTEFENCLTLVFHLGFFPIYLNWIVHIGYNSSRNSQYHPFCNDKISQYTGFCLAECMTHFNIHKTYKARTYTPSYLTRRSQDWFYVFLTVGNGELRWSTQSASTKK